MPDTEELDQKQDTQKQEISDEYEDVSSLTKNESPPSFNRGKVLKIICLSVGAIIVSAFVFNSVNKSRNRNKTNVTNAANVSVPDSIRRDRDNAKRRNILDKRELVSPFPKMAKAGLSFLILNNESKRRLKRSARRLRIGISIFTEVF